LNPGGKIQGLIFYSAHLTQSINIKQKQKKNKGEGSRAAISNFGVLNPDPSFFCPYAFVSFNFSFTRKTLKI